MSGAATSLAAWIALLLGTVVPVIAAAQVPTPNEQGAQSSTSGPSDVDPDYAPPATTARPRTQFVFDGQWLPYPRNEREAFYIYENYSRSPLAAFALEFFLPSGGLIYTRRYSETAIYWLGMLTGTVLLVSGLGGPFDAEPDTLRVASGFTILGVLRIGAMIYAPYVAMAYNDALRYRLGVQGGVEMEPPYSQPPYGAVRPREMPEFPRFEQPMVQLPLLSLRF